VSRRFAGKETIRAIAKRSFAGGMMDEIGERR
jgi:hypothetical protein